jgi:hypothetical protein
LNFQCAIGLIQQCKDVTPNAIPLIPSVKAVKQRAGLVKKHLFGLFLEKLTGQVYTIVRTFYNFATSLDK